MEGVGDEFLQAPIVSGQEIVEPDIKCVGEVVSSALYASKTASKAEKTVILKANYGDLPEALWEGRADQERAWMAPGDDDNVLDLESQALPQPDRTIIIGTNGVYSFALQCEDDDSVPFDKSAFLNPKEKPTNRDELVEIINQYQSEYAKSNVAFGFKRQLSEYESAAFVLAMKYELANTHLSGDARNMIERITDMARVDTTLRSAISKLGGRVTQKMKTLPQSLAKGQRRPTPKTADRPGGAFPTVKFMLIEFHPIDSTVRDAEIDGRGGDTTFRLLVCKTPTEAKKDKNKRPRWIDVNLSIHTDAKTVPACAFNDTHFAVLYLPQTVVRNAVIFVDLFEIPAAGFSSSAGKSIGRIARFGFRFPPQFSNHGMINMHLSTQGIISVCFANGVLVFDAFQLLPQIHVIILEAEDEATIPRRRRKIGTAAVFHPAGFARPLKDASEPKDAWCGTVVLGTDKGESFGIDWRTGQVRFIEATPAVEPIFAVHYSNGKTFAQTVMSISGSISNLGPANQITVLPLDRPIGMDTCGALIFVVSKYGFVKVFSSIARQIAREFPPPVTGSKTPLLQHAYKAIRAYHDHVVMVYPSGVVRNLILTSRPK